MGGGTDTAVALRQIREKGFFGSSNQIRENSARILIVMTDGLSLTPDTTDREAKLLKKMGVQIFSIGIGSGIDKLELEDIASDPVDKFFLHVDDFGALDTVKMKLAARTCTIPPTDSFSFFADQAGNFAFIPDSLFLHKY
jgi:collagen type VI alpha